MGQLKIIELTETYTGIRFQDFEKIQSESQSLSQSDRLFCFEAVANARIRKQTKSKKAPPIA